MISHKQDLPQGIINKTRHKRLIKKLKYKVTEKNPNLPDYNLICTPDLFAQLPLYNKDKGSKKSIQMTNTMAIDSGINLAQLSYPLTEGYLQLCFATSVIFLHVRVAVNLVLTALVTKRETLGGGRITEESIFLSFKDYKCLTTTIIRVTLINGLNTLLIALRYGSDIFLLTY